MTPGDLTLLDRLLVEWKPKQSTFGQPKPPFPARQIDPEETPSKWVKRSEDP